MIHHYVKTGLCLVVLLIFSVTLNAQLITPFSSIYQTNQRGGIVFLSNSALGCSANPPAATGTCLAGALETPLLGTTRNDDFLATYIDIDGDASTFMSSSDRLDLQPCSRITKAILFWGASGTATTNFNQVKLKVNTGSYQTVTATNSTVNTTGINSYHCYADVTNLLSPNGIADRITVADIASSAIGTANAFGSWNLVVVYNNDAMAMRQLTVFNGLAYLSVLNPTLNVQLSGFLTPTLGAVSFEIGAYSHDGDRGTTGDNIMFNGNLLFLPLSDVITNPAGDVMNSTVSNNGVANVFRNPLLNNTMGSDADIYAPVNLLNGYLANSATTATVQLMTTTDDYLTQALTSSIDTYEPDLRATVKARDINGGTLNPGDLVEYRIRGANFGNDGSTNTFITDTLSQGVTYIPNSTRITFGQNIGNKTDAAGDDQVDYDAATRILKIRIGTGANASTGGAVGGTFTGVDSTVVTYSVAISQSCLRLSCNNTITARAYIAGTGSVFPAHTHTVRSTPGNDALGCQLISSTNSTVNTTSCPTPTASSNSPVCSGGSVFLTATNDPGATYAWSGPSSFASAVMNPTLSNVTTGLSGLYSVTLTVTGLPTCSATANTQVTVIACPPTAVNDFTNTTANVAVSGNAAANDLNGVPNGTFSILNQPANGTVTINNSGIYSFTPALNFTGVTSATYQLCNGNPSVCATAVITITVYTTLVAVPDVINTTPSVTATGSLLANDTGTATGVTYNVTFTQLPASTGTLTVNAATGQYTFVPNNTYTGTSQTTYTVCNVTVNPSQCSSASISINVSNLPVAVNDATATTINTTVSGNAGANDSGTFGGTFTFGNVANGTGTLTGGPLTGFYTYVPASGFTGTTSATYTLCNLNSPPCSTATITFTVYPDLITVNDVISTTPTSNANGNLLSNDTGITPGALYSVSSSSVPVTTGTLTVDPATGSYTFAPNPGFTGTAQTSYTVCNNSVNPQQCSSATIDISVNIIPAPVAVNDATLTLMGTAVSGDVSLNDSNTSGGMYTFNGPSPITGNLVGDAATGQYTFIPYSGFSGVTYASYTVCTVNAVPCATALITFTVYPTLEAKADVINTFMNNSVSGNLQANDAGTFPGGTYSINISQPSSTIGVISVDGAGQYTIVPAAGYHGNSATTYTITQYNGNTFLQSSIAGITIIVREAPSPLGIAKSISNVAYNTNGTFYLTYKVVVKNYSNQPLTSVSVSDDLSAAFPLPTTYTVTGSPMISNASGSQLTINNGFTGSSNALQLTTATSSSLAAGRADTILFTVHIDPHNYQFSYSNSARAEAVLMTSTVTDVSTNGIDPDPDHDGDPGNNNTSTVFSFDLVKIGLAKYAGESEPDGNGCYTTTFKFTIKNYGAAPIYNIQLFDNLNQTFGNITYNVHSLSVSGNSSLTANNAFNGSSNYNLLTYNSHLGVGKTDTVYLHISYCSDATLSFSNTAVVYGNSVPGGGFIGYDISMSGLDPDPNGNNNPSDTGEDAVTGFVPGETFQIPEGFSPNNDGINDRFEILGLKKFPQLEVTILSRWGNMVYNKKQYDNSWDGKSTEGLQFGGNELPEGTYYYIVDPGEGKKAIKGFVYLSRASK